MTHESEPQDRTDVRGPTEEAPVSGGPSPSADGAPAEASSSNASRVAVGILSSRAFGLLRESLLAFFFGAGPHADVFRIALRGPNLLQNLLGEQTLSASFIPIYSRMVAAGKAEEAGRFAGAILGLLMAVVSSVALLGVLFAEPIVAMLAPGYLGDAARVGEGLAEVDRFRLAVPAVRIVFPMTAVLVLSAWSLGVLNSHRRFFLAYFAPVLWNISIILALCLTAFTGWQALGGPASALGETTFRNRLLIAACIGALIGGVLQFAVQLPVVFRLLKGFRLSVSPRVEGVSKALGAFAPLAAGRGAVQLSGYFDLVLASFLVPGAIAALGWAQTLYLLPIALFGVSVAAAELPELSVQTAREDQAVLASRLDASIRKMAFLTVPTVVGYLCLGFYFVGGIFRRGNFGLQDNWLVYLVLAAYSLGLLASSTSRLLNNVFYALGRTRIPARVAVERVVLSALVGGVSMVWLDRVPVSRVAGPAAGGRELFMGAVGLALGASLGALFELWRLASALDKQGLGLRLPARSIGRMVATASLTVAPVAVMLIYMQSLPMLAKAVVALLVYVGLYLSVARLVGLPELGYWLGSLRRRAR
jgi:putative peptidoglycan lipid II flippase